MAAERGSGDGGRRFNVSAPAKLSEIIELIIGGMPAGECELCLTVGQVVVDHSHTSGKVRGLLCPSCNAALHAKWDDAEWKRRALAYLDQDTGLDYPTDVSASVKAEARRQVRAFKKGVNVTRPATVVD